MSKTKLVILVIILIIVAFIAGIFLGYLEDTPNSISESSTSIENSRTNTEYTVTNDFIINSKGKDFFEKICKLNNIEIIDPTEMADSWNYENGNDNSNFQVNSDKTTDEIYYIKIMTLSEINLDEFLNVCELEYEKNDIGKAKEWVKNNINKKVSTTIGNMHFEINVVLNRPTLEIYTKNGKTYESQQESKSLE